jgi:hypothetical protein
MKVKILKSTIQPALTAVIIACLLLTSGMINAQDDPAVKTGDATLAVKAKPVKNTFQSVWIIDNQTVMVPVKGTFELDIMHRFGIWNKGYEDFWGFFAPSNIRLGVSYAPIKNLNVGLGVTKTTMGIIPYAEKPSSIAGPLWDGSVKYSIFTQTKGQYPVSLTYYGNAAFNTKKDPDNEIYQNYSDRLSYFHQLIIAQKINDKLSIQIAPNHSHHNLVNGYFVKLDSVTLKTKPEMKHDHFAVSLSARYKLTKVTSLLLNYDQPITKHVRNNPNPNFSLGLEFNTSSHAFQLFFTNYQYMVPQINNLYNSNDPLNHNLKGNGGYPWSPEFLIGFNITRLWNY